MLSALWLPANNYLLEGRVLLSLGESHGVTVSDLFGAFAFLLGTTAVLYAAAREGRGRTRVLASAAGCVLIFLSGAAAAFATG